MLVTGAILALACGSGTSAAPEAPSTGGTPAGEGAGVFPLRIAASGRYLVDQHGTPWPLLGDAGWSAVGQLTDGEKLTYLDGLKALGFNLTLVTLVETAYSDFVPGNAYGEPPFTGTIFRSAPNEAYWARVDAYVRAAGERGITVLMTPAYIGYGGDGVGSLMVAASNAQMQAYGEFLGTRYRGHPNVMWMIGGDRTTTDPTLLARSNAVAVGIKNRDPNHLMTAHTADGVTAASQWGVYPWLDVNAGYFIEADKYVAQNAAAYADTPTRPVFNVEGIYEQERSPVISYRDLRYQAWAALMTGSFGHIFGNNPRWHMGSGYIFPSQGTWQQSLTTAPYNKGSLQFTLFGSFVRANSGWAQTVPDTGYTFLTGGEGSGNDQAAARFSAAARLGLVYLPSARPITLDLTEFAGVAGQVQVRRYDPTNGSYSSVGTYPTTGPQTIPSLGANADGASDWVIVVTPP